MPQTRRRKLPVTLAERHGSSSTPRASRTIIRRFHTLLKQQKCAQGDALANINREIEALGGLEEYQRMSCVGQSDDRGGGSEKVLIGWLKRMGWAAVADGDGKEDKARRSHRCVEAVRTAHCTLNTNSHRITPRIKRGCRRVSTTTKTARGRRGQA
jgi:25S rRNA (adenine2142-N1)-methyltransferase